MLQGRHVLLIEDLIDSGHTLHWAKQYLEEVCDFHLLHSSLFFVQQQPASLRIVVFLNKHGRRASHITRELCSFATCSTLISFSSQ